MGSAWMKIISPSASVNRVIVTETCASGPLGVSWSGSSSSTQGGSGPGNWRSREVIWGARSSNRLSRDAGLRPPPTNQIRHRRSGDRRPPAYVRNQQISMRPAAPLKSNLSLDKSAIWTFGKGRAVGDCRWRFGLTCWPGSLRRVSFGKSGSVRGPCARGGRRSCRDGPGSRRTSARSRERGWWTRWPGCRCGAAR